MARDDARVAELAALRQRQQLLIGHAAPEEERQARRKAVLIDGVHGTRRRIVGRRREAVQELRAREHDHQRVAHAVLETAGGTPGLVELERDSKIRVGHGPPIGRARETRDDLARAGRLIGGRLRAAAEDALAARRVAQARSRERPVDLEPLDLQRALLAFDDPDLAAAGHERLQDGVGFRHGARDERGRDRVRPGRHRHADVLEPAVDLGDGRSLAQIDRFDVVGPADLVLEHLLAVDRENQPVPVFEAFDVARPSEAAEVELVVAVGREEMLDEHAAARAERHARDVVVLVDAGRGVVDAAVALRVRVADGHLADDACGRDVLLQERRRHLEHVRDVVEAVALVVLRQQRLHVDLEREQVRDRIGVFGAIQAVQRDLPRIRRGRGGGIERALEPRDPRAARRVVGLRRAGRRHLRAAQLAHDGFENLWLVRDRLGGHAIERDLGREVVAVVAVAAVLRE